MTCGSVSTVGSCVGAGAGVGDGDGDDATDANVDVVGIGVGGTFAVCVGADGSIVAVVFVIVNRCPCADVIVV